MSATLRERAVSRTLGYARLVLLNESYMDGLASHNTEVIESSLSTTHGGLC